MIPPLPNEAAALRAMLGNGPLVLLDIKPVELLTAGERRQFAERLAAVTREMSRLFNPTKSRHPPLPAL